MERRSPNRRGNKEGGNALIRRSALRQNKGPWSAFLNSENLQQAYFSFASALLTASKLGRSFGVGVCSLYCTTSLLSMTKAARAAVSPIPTSIGKTTSYFLMTSLFKSL